MHALTIFIQRPYRQAPLLAKGRSQQSARFKLANQGLDLGKTTSPVYHSHFAHSSSATLNAEQEQGALLKRILITVPHVSFRTYALFPSGNTGSSLAVNRSTPPLFGQLSLPRGAKYVYTELRAIPLGSSRRTTVNPHCESEGLP
jgi:hypothetical protein